MGRYLLFFCACLSFGQITQGSGGSAVVPAAGVVKSNGTVLQTATAGTDYQAPVPACTGPLKSPGGTAACATAGTDYQPAFTSGTTFPSSACANGNQYYRTDTGDWFQCQLNAWRPNSSDAAFQTALANLRSAQNSLARVVILGDSLARCWGASGNASSTCAGTGPAVKANLWPPQLRTLASSYYGNHGSGIIPITAGLPDNTVTTDPGTYTLAGTTANASFIGPALGTVGTIWSFNAAATLTMAPQYASSFNVYYVTGTDSAAGFTAAIDGVGVGTFGAIGGTLTARVLNIPASTIGTHTLVLTAVANHAYFYAVEAVASPVGVSVDNLSMGGAQTACWQNSSHTAYNDMLTNVALVIISLGTNEQLHSVPTATYQSQLSTMIAHAKSTWPTAQIIVMNEPWDQFGTPSQSGYYTAAAAAASANSVTLLDPTSTLFPSFAVQNANGWMDTGLLHMNDSGQQVWGRWILDRIFGVWRTP